MQIVPISFKILNPYHAEFTDNDGHNLLRHCEYIGRISHRSEDKVDTYSHMRFIESVVMGHGDLSIIEHASISIEVEVDRGISHEIVRHRIGAYTQESTRFVNYGKKPMRFIKPNEDALWEDAFIALEESYLRLLEDKGYPPQIARAILPNALATKLVMTYNLRMWRHFLIMRTSRETHPQMKQLTIPLLLELKDKVPIIFDDIEPEQKQSEAMRKLR
jgi:thymidylate synthase (FAD)